MIYDLMNLLTDFDEPDVFCNHISPTNSNYKVSRFKYVSEISDIPYKPYKGKVYRNVYKKIKENTIFTPTVDKDLNFVYIPQVGKYLIYGNLNLLKSYLKKSPKGESTLFDILYEVINDTYK